MDIDKKLDGLKNMLETAYYKDLLSIYEDEDQENIEILTMDDLDESATLDRNRRHKILNLLKGSTASHGKFINFHYTNKEGGTSLKVFLPVIGYNKDGIDKMFGFQLQVKKRVDDESRERNPDKYGKKKFHASTSQENYPRTLFVSKMNKIGSQPLNKTNDAEGKELMKNVSSLKAPGFINKMQAEKKTNRVNTPNWHNGEIWFSIHPHVKMSENINPAFIALLLAENNTIFE